MTARTTPGGARPGFQFNFVDDSTPYALEAAHRSRRIEVSHCVNCIGVGFDVDPGSEAARGQLLRDEVVNKHPIGGVWLNPDTMAVVSGEQAEMELLESNRQMNDQYLRHKHECRWTLRQGYPIPDIRTRLHPCDGR